MPNRQHTKQPDLRDTSSSSSDSVITRSCKSAPKQSKMISDEQIAILKGKIDSLQSSVKNTNDLIKTMETSLDNRIATNKLDWIGRYSLIVVRFQHVKDRDLVWHKRKDLSEGHYIRAMYPPTNHRKRRVLQAISNYAETISRYTGTHASHFQSRS